MDKKETLKQHLNESRQKLWAILENVQADQWDVQVQSEGEQWTVLQMVRHLQDAHRGLSGQAKRIVAGEPNLPPDFDLDRWNSGVQRKTTDMSAETALENLQTSHEKLLAFVDSLQDADWAKEGFQASFKQPMTLDKFIEIIGSHEVLHATEIASALGKN